MDSLINIINKLQDVFNTIGAETIELPQIVVVGNQSAGKSSVIEAIVKKDFLPRGAGMVTRCPLVLQLIQIQKNKNQFKKEEEGRLSDESTQGLEEWAEFLHNKNKVYTNFGEVRKEIEDQTERLSGGKKNICSDPITLKVYSTKVVNLTLVDLPGTTKLPVDDQPIDIEDQIRDLILKYISNPKSIILAVTPANIDFATSEALKLAKQVDPDGLRTLAVLTKLDLMDAGTDAADVLLSRVIPVKLGIIGVVNRSQQDIMDEKSIQAALKDEIAFLQKKYAALASRNGSTYLVKTLNSLLIKHIQKHLPELKTLVRDKEAEQRVLRENLGEALDGQHKKSTKLIQLISDFVQLYRNAIESTPNEDIETAELIGGARICAIFEKSFSEELDLIDPLQGLTNSEIENLIRNCTGLSPALGVPQQALGVLIKRQLKKLVAPSSECAKWTHDELEKIVHECDSKMEHNGVLFSRLRNKILHLTLEMLQVRLPVTNQVVTDVLNSELAYVNFKKLDSDVYQRLVNPKEVTADLRGVAGDVFDDDEEKADRKCDDVRKLVKSYFDLVREQIKDLAPKITVKFLIFFVKENLLTELVDKLNHEAVLNDLLSEDEVTPLKRKEADDMLQALTKALKIIGEIDHRRA